MEIEPVQSLLQRMFKNDQGPYYNKPILRHQEEYVYRYKRINNLTMQIIDGILKLGSERHCGFCNGTKSPEHRSMAIPIHMINDELCNKFSPTEIVSNVESDCRLKHEAILRTLYNMINITHSDCLRYESEDMRFTKLNFQFTLRYISHILALAENT